MNLFARGEKGTKLSTWNVSTIFYSTLGPFYKEHIFIHSSKISTQRGRNICVCVSTSQSTSTKRERFDFDFL